MGMGSSESPRTALIVIDLQVCVVGDCFDGTGVLARTAKLIERAREAEIPVIYVQDESDGTQHGSPGWQLAPPLSPLPGEPRVFKRYRDSFAGTDLEGMLKQRNISRLLFAGAQSDFCVRTTAQRAAALGYDCVLINDCHTTRDAQLGDGVVITGEQLVAHTNQYFIGLTYPAYAFGLANHNEVVLTVP